MGLLPDVAQDLGIDIPTAGHLISAYALGVVIGAPVLAVLGARWPWRRLLIALMGAYAIGNFLTVIAPSYETVLVTRFLAGFPHGTYFGVAALVAARLVPPHRRAQAVAYVMLGLTVATLLGVPIATALGQWLSWQAAFTFVSIIALITMALVLRFVPFVPPQYLGQSLARARRPETQASLVDSRYRRDWLWRHVLGIQLCEIHADGAGRAVSKRHSRCTGSVWGRYDLG